MATLTLVELRARLANKDPDELLDLLGLDSEKILDLASDIIEEKFDELSEEVSDIDEFLPEEYRPS